MKLFESLLIISGIALTGCAPVRLPNSQTAPEVFSTLGYHEKTVAKRFYEFGASDTAKRLYWAQRNLQQWSGYAK
jgi:hypothetical protein